MENKMGKYNELMSSKGYDNFVLDFFGKWEIVKDEILIPERKTGTGNGTIHIFLGGNNVDKLEQSFPDYFKLYRLGTAKDSDCPKIKHYVKISNLLSVVGHTYHHLVKNNISETDKLKFDKYIEQLKAYGENDVLEFSSLFKMASGNRPYFKQFEGSVFNDLIRLLFIPSISAYQIFLYQNSNANEFASFWLIGQNSFENSTADISNISFPKTKKTVETNLNYKTFLTDIKNANYYANNKLCLRFISSLLTKPFVILTGLSGSGKTKLAQAFATWICENENQYCIVPVGADWTNREPLLGFPNALESGKYILPDNGALGLILEAAKGANSNKPYFLILDEMNLSHVERYFADFLSIMESNGKFSLHSGSEEWNNVPSEIKLPKNLFIIGTVNIDETTYMFSPKVLDRASVIEFRVTADEMKDYLKSTTSLDLDNLKSAGSNMAEAFVEIAQDKYLQTINALDLQTALNIFFVELKKTGAEFGYRSAAEIFRFAAVVNTIEPDWTIIEIIDAAIMQKLLPKVHGSRRKLEPVLKTLGTLCLQDSQNIDEFISPKIEIDFNDTVKIKYPVSLEKILRMNRCLIDNGFTSYAEA